MKVITNIPINCRVDKRSASTIIIKHRWMRYAYPPYGLMLIILASVWSGNVCQAAQQYRQINTAKGRQVISATASVGGPSPGSGNKKSGTQFPVVPAGAMASQAGSLKQNQQNQLYGKTGTNSPTRVATLQNQPAVATAGTSGQAINATPQQAGGAANTSNQLAPTASGSSAANASQASQQQKATASGKKTMGKGSSTPPHSATPPEVSGQNSGNTQPKQ